VIKIADSHISLASPLVPLAFQSQSSAMDNHWDQALSSLEKLRDLADDWDGQGASAPEVANLDQASTWISEMRQWRHALPPTRVSPGTLGEVILEWRGESFHLVAEVANPIQVEWLLKVPDQPIRHWQTDASNPWIVRADHEK
jgi:hypothetical protein